MARKDGKNRGLYQYSDGSWGVEYYDGKKRVRRKIGTKPEARAYYGEIERRKRVGDVLPEKRSVVQPVLLAELLEQRLKVVRGATIYHVREWISAVGTLSPYDITMEFLQRWVEKSLAVGLRPASVARRLDALSPVFTQLVKQGKMLAADNPCANKRSLGLPHLNNQREKPLTDAQELRLLECLGETWYPYLEFGILTAMRLGNQFGLRWSDINWESGFLMLPVTKNGRRHPIRISKRVAEILKMMRARHPDAEFCFPSPEGKQMHPSNFRNRYWHPALVTAGLRSPQPSFSAPARKRRALAGIPEPPKQKTVTGSRDPEALTWHDATRHTAASRLLRNGVDLYTAMHVLGHRDYRTTQRYAHVADEKLQEAMEALSKQRVNGESDSTTGEQCLKK